MNDRLRSNENQSMQASTGIGRNNTMNHQIPAILFNTNPSKFRNQQRASDSTHSDATTNDTNMPLMGSTHHPHRSTHHRNNNAFGAPAHSNNNPSSVHHGQFANPSSNNNTNNPAVGSHNNNNSSSSLHNTNNSNNNNGFGSLDPNQLLNIVGGQNNTGGSSNDQGNQSNLNIASLLHAMGVSGIQSPNAQGNNGTPNQMAPGSNPTSPHKNNDTAAQLLAAYQQSMALQNNNSVMQTVLSDSNSWQTQNQLQIVNQLLQNQQQPPISSGNSMNPMYNVGQYDGGNSTGMEQVNGVQEVNSRDKKKLKQKPDGKLDSGKEVGGGDMGAGKT